MNSNETNTVTDDDDTNKPPTPIRGRWYKGMPSPNKHGRGHVANKFSRKVVEELAKHFHVKGYAAIDRVCQEEPSTYLKIIVQLIPKELLVQVARPLENMSDAELAMAAEEERSQQLKVIEHIKDRVGAEIVEAAAREVVGTEDEDDEDTA